MATTSEHQDPDSRPGYTLVIRMTITRNGRKIRRPNGKPWAFWVKNKK